MQDERLQLSVYISTVDYQRSSPPMAQLLPSCLPGPTPRHYPHTSPAAPMCPTKIPNRLYAAEPDDVSSELQVEAPDIAPPTKPGRDASLGK